MWKLYWKNENYRIWKKIEFLEQKVFDLEMINVKLGEIFSKFDEEFLHFKDSRKKNRKVGVAFQ